MKYWSFVTLIFLGACDDDASTAHKTLSLKGCQDRGLYTDAYFIKHGDDQTLELKCGGAK